MIPFEGKRPDKSLLHLADNCSLFTNPIKARTTIVTNKLNDSSITLDTILKTIPEPRVEDLFSNSNNAATTPSSKEEKFLNAVGVTRDHLTKVKSVIGKYKQTMSLIENFSIEQMRDMPIIIGALNQYVTDREVLGCSLANEVFSFINGHGAAILEGIGVNVTELIEFGNKLQDFITASIKDFNAAVSKFENWIDDATNFVNRLEDLSDNWRQEVEAAIKLNLDKIQEILTANLNSFIVKLLPTWMANSCLSGAIGPAISSKARSAIMNL